MTAIQVASGKGDGGLQRQVCSCHSPCTLPTMALVLSLGSWLLLFVVELAANASEGEELLHDTRLVAYLASVGFAAVTCILLLILCARSATRASYQSVIPAKDDRISGNDRRMPLLWHYLIHGTLVTATICWIAIHSAMLQHQQAWGRGRRPALSLLDFAMNLDDIVSADTGEVPAVCYCAMKRPGGLLLAVPHGFVPAHVLLEAEQEGFPDLVGPHVVTSAQVVELSESGDWIGVYPARKVNVLLVDLSERAASALEVLEEGLGECVPFSSSPMHFPVATALTSFAASWSDEAGGNRGAGYVTVSGSIVSAPAAPASVAKLLGAPPRVKPPVCFFDPATEGGLGSSAWYRRRASLGNSALTTTVLAQSKLTALVAQIAGQGDPMSDLGSSSSS
eukprot:s1170_g20.t1